MTIDVVSRLDFLVELFEGRRDSVAAPEGQGSGNWSTPSAAVRSAQTLTLLQMLGEAQTLLEAFSRNFVGVNADVGEVSDRIARFLADNAETIEEDAPRSPRVLHYVYPIV
jgi:hypothetical protein